MTISASRLHRAVLCGSRAVVTLLLDRGADIHALGSKRALDVQPIDVAIGRETGHNINPDMVALLVSRGATYDLTIAAALGDLEGVRRMLDESPERIRESRPKGKRPLSTRSNVVTTASRVCCLNAARIRNGTSPTRRTAPPCT